MHSHTKRQLVEEYLGSICTNLDMCDSASEPYGCEEESFFLEDTLGLVWKDSFAGWQCNRPSNEQVEKLYTVARAHFEIEEMPEGDN